MSDRNFSHNGSADSDETAALITAYALGELSGAEHDEFETRLARNPQWQQQVAETRLLSQQLGDVLRGEPLPANSTTLRERLADQLEFVEVMKAPPPAKRHLPWVAAVSGLALAGTVVALMLPGMQISPEVAKLGAKTTTAHSDLLESQSLVLGTPRGERTPLSASLERGANGQTQPTDFAVLDGNADNWSELTIQRKKYVPISSSASGEARGPGGEQLREQAGGYAQNDVKPAAGNATNARLYSQGIDGGAAKGPQDEVKAEPGLAPGQPLAQTPSATSQTFSRGVGVNSDTGVKAAGASTSGPKQGNGASRGVTDGRYYAIDDVQYQANGPRFPLSRSTVRTESEAPGVSTFSLAPQNEVKRLAVLQEDELSTAEQYDRIVENAFLTPQAAPLSTFSIDVDTASYANTRRFLTGGQLPPPSAVRIEELINYFSYDDPQPAGDVPFSAQMELAECPWNPGHHVLRIGLKGKEMENSARPNSNLVFLLDVSGSMAADNKLPLVKQAMQLLVRELRENDCVTIVTYAGQEGLALDSTPGDQKEKINQAIETLNSGGSTHASAGITLAYEKAQEHFIKDGANRVILCTDGDFNVGVTNDEALVDLITTKAKSGVFLSVLGFGMGNLKDAKMEKLADKGNGNYAYIDTLREGRKVLVEEMAANLVTIAKDVKIQIEFNPAMIASYRQIGYENRVLAARDFNDDTKDAGEIGAGHSVTALYEVVLVGNEKAAQPQPESEIPLKYQKMAPKSPGTSGEAAGGEATTESAFTPEAATGELLTLKLRYKQPTGDKSELLEFPFKDQAKKFGQASENLRFASAVAALGMLLRNSEHRGGATFSAVEEIAGAALGKDPNGYRSEFLELVRRAAHVSGQ